MISLGGALGSTFWAVVLSLVPHPDTAALDPAVQTQLAAARDRLQRAVGLQRAESYGYLGQLYHAYEFLKPSQACYENAAALAPGEFKWRYYLALVYQAEGEPAKAGAAFEAALRLNPAHVAAMLHLAEARLEQNDADAASALYEQILKLERSPAALAGLGKIALGRQDYSSAIRQLEAALVADPKAGGLFYPLAMAYRGAGNAEKARELLSRRVTGNPVIQDPLMDEVRDLAMGKQNLWMRGWTAFREGNFAKAAAEYRKMTESDPSEPIGWMELGSAILKLGDFEAALKDYRRAVQLAPENAVAHLNLAMCLTQIGATPQALEHYRTAIRLDPGLTRAYFHFGNELMRAGNPAEAAAMYGKGVELEPGNSFARFMQAMALVRLHRYAAARECLEQARTAFPEDLDFANALARLLAAAPDAAVRDGPRSLQLASGLLRSGTAPDLEYGLTFAMALAGTGDFARAAQVQRAIMAEVHRANRPKLEAKLAETLKLYESERPNRLPWPEDDPVFRPMPGEANPVSADLGAMR